MARITRMIRRHLVVDIDNSGKLQEKGDSLITMIPEAVLRLSLAPAGALA
jgi:ribose 1,5-bisphosphokinase PhnN